MLQLEIHRGTVPLSGEAEGYIRERADHLDMFYPRILTCRVTLEAPVNHHRQGGPYRVSLDLDVPGKVIAVNHREADDLHVAIRKAFEAAQRQLEDHARVQRGQVKVPVTGHEAGTIARLFPVEGYGFIESENGHEVYFHQNAVLGPGFGALEIGMKVGYVEELGNEGPQASTVTPE